MRKHAIFRPTDADVAGAAEAFRLLGDPTRLRIMWRLRQGPATVTELAAETGAAMPATSQHLAKLRISNLVQATRAGNRMVYELGDHHVAELVEHALAHLHHAGRAGHGSSGSAGPW